VSSLDLLSKYLLIMELRFDAMLCSNLGNENSDAGHIKCSRGPQVPHPCSRESMKTSLNVFYFLMKKSRYLYIWKSAWQFPCDIIATHEKLSNEKMPVFYLSESTQKSIFDDVFIESLAQSVRRVMAETASKAKHFGLSGPYRLTIYSSVTLNFTVQCTEKKFW